MQSSTSVTSVGPKRREEEALPNLTPRSEKACLLAGVEPRELVPLAVEAFAEPGQPTALQNLKWRRYEECRQEAFKLVQAERERLIEREQQRQGLESLVSEADGRPSAEGGATSLLHEQRMIEKLKRRQQAEIESMFLQEIKTMKVLEEKADRIKISQELEERRAMERQLRLKQQAEQKYQQDIERMKQEELHEREVRKKQAEEMERECQLKEEAEKAEKKRQQQLVKREADRQRRLAEKKARQQDQLEEKQAEARKKAQEEAEREYHRLQRIEEKRQAQAVAAARQRERAAKRVSGVLRAHAERVEQQRRAFLEKQDADEQRRVVFHEAREREIADRRRKGEERQKEIHAKLSTVERRAEERKMTILEKERQHEDMMAQVDLSRERKAQVDRVERDMHFYNRQQKLAQNLRREEYKRQMTAVKIQKENERADELAAQRRELLKQRRLMRSESTLARERVASRIDQMRSSSSFDFDEQVRSYIHNPELNELLERCIECRPHSGPQGCRVTMDTMRTALAQMQAEGKLSSLGESRKGKTESGAFKDQISRSAPDLFHRPGTAA